MNDDSARSADACPVCGEHRLTLLSFPSVDPSGVRPYDELLGFGDVQADTLPGIGCLACGAEWETLADYEATAGESRAG
jgi:hypothetical protein